MEQVEVGWMGGGGVYSGKTTENSCTTRAPPVNPSNDKEHNHCYVDYSVA